MGDGGKKTKTNVDGIKSPLSWVWKKMVEMGLVTSPLEDDQNTPDGYCLYHNEQGHDIQECVDFKVLVQSMMDNKQMEFYEEATPEEIDVYASEEETPRKDVESSFSVVIISGSRRGEMVEGSRPRVVIQRPMPFPYKDNKVVPWRYDCDMAIQGKNDSGERVNDVGFFTRSGRRYVPKEGEYDKIKGKTLIIEPEKRETSAPESPINEPVKEEEVREFLKFLKHSEYNVVEQLHKLPARISVLALLLSSESHRNALLKVLNETFVPKDISVNKLDKLANNINADNFIYFNDDEIPPNGRGSAKALHITTRCKGYTLPGVLIDNGSALNVLPLSTLNRLPVDSSHMKTCHNLVRAFDGTERSVMGRIEIPLQIGPIVYDVDFLVMDIKPTYNCLLGRPWIHSAGAIPSSLHQKLKYISDGRLITVNVEEDIIASISSDAPYVAVDEDAVECSFRSLEFVNATFIAEGNRIPVPKLSKTTRMGIKLTVGKGARVGRGFGKYLQGRVNAPVLANKQDRFGLGYRPDARQRRAEMIKRQERRKARLSGTDVKWEPMTFPPLSKTFVSGGFENLKSDHEVEDLEELLEVLDISAILDENKENNLSGIYPYAPGTALDNWTAEALPAVFKNISESPDISKLSNDETDLEPVFEQEECLDESQDFEEDPNCDLSLELLRMVEHEEKQILPHKESVKVVSLGEENEQKEIKIGTCITAETRKTLIELLQEFKVVFAWSYQDMPGLGTDIVVHKLPIKENCKPVQQKLRRMRVDVLLKIKEEVKKQFDADFLQVVKYSEWVANIVPVPKKDGKVRVDYRDLNKASPKDNFPLPHIDTLVDNTAKQSFFSFMDGFSGYNQIRMHPNDMDKTTFVTPWGTFCYKVMPFGLKNAGATYQCAMVTLFHDMMHKEIEVYVDDMIAKSRTEEEHVEVLRKLFLRLRKFQLKLNPAKCTFGVTSGKLLGFIVSEKRIEVDPDKVKAIQDLLPPRTPKEVRGFLGRLNYIARFISQLTEKCDPIFRLLKKHNPGEWNEECQEAFDKIKHYLSNTPILVPPVLDKPLILYLSVSENSMGCVLGQHDETGRKERAIYYLSKKFTECEARYSSIEKLCCALVWTTKRLRQYMLYHTTWLISKLDPIKYVMGSTMLIGRMARWQILLSEFDLVYVNQKAIKGSVIADFLASRASENYEPLNFDFPNEDLMCVLNTEEGLSLDKYWKLNFDGALNDVGKGIGAVLVSPEGDHYPFACKLDFYCTNNIAEYEACIMGIRAAIERKVKLLKVYGDSMLVIYQLRGEWGTRDLKLIDYKNLVMELVRWFDDITFHYLPREENQMADALATLSSLIQVNDESNLRPIQMSMYEVPAHCYNVEEERSNEHPWYHDILQYIKNHEYPEQATDNEKRTLRRLASEYILDGEILYKRRKDQVLLRCVDEVEAKKILEEVHEGVCGTHANGFMMARQIMRFGYYWSTMEGDCIKYAKKCHKCQIYGDKIHVPPSPLHVMTSPWPFSMWGMDVIGPISPKASNGHRFIFVAIDYFTKWVEAASYASVTRATVVRFLKKEIICRYGMPKKIISDNAKNLNNTAIEGAANKNIKKIVAKMAVTYKDWHEKLSFALLAYRTSVRTSTGATPFSLVYGIEAVLPIEVEFPSLRVLFELNLEEAEWIQARYDQLNLIEEKRLKAIQHGMIYQKRMMRAYDKRVRPREFQEGDLVL
ncbi:hypothetical protein V6N12_069210 [Hibiscus sabdariffa]|uniref:RNA-directed DNA polymerase n=1 Tax=Hibiscus sabdariffa TaxID=183260 RepID=A0ABR2FDC4_9ROSI